MTAELGIEDLDPSIQPIVERARRALLEGEQIGFVEMTASEFERLWKGLGWRGAPPQGATLYGFPILVTDG